MKIKQQTDPKIVEGMYKDGLLYSYFGEYWRRKYGYKVFKIPFNASFTCPNWDGRLSKTGCTFCPSFARQFTYSSFRTVINQSLEEQVKNQVKHYQEIGAGKKGLVYIAFGTNTYMPLKDLKKIYDTALKHKDVVGLSIGTRPDCLPAEVLDLLGGYVKKGKEIWLEIGQQTIHQKTLDAVKRRHGFAEAMKAVEEAHARGIKVVFFIILGLPGETHSEMVETARVLSAMGVDAVKLYPLIVMKKTQLAIDYQEGRYTPIGFKEYVNTLCDFLENLDRNVLIQRLSKDCGLETKLAPEWNTYRLIVGPAVEKELKRRKTRQGSRLKYGLPADELIPLAPAEKMVFSGEEQGCDEPELF
jgi:radical SAM protein (TIGR01212 family)